MRQDTRRFGLHQYYVLRYRLVRAVTACLGFFLVAPWALGQNSSGEQPDPKAVEALRALGYIDFPSENPSERARGHSGLMLYRARRSSPGYTLITSLPDAGAILVDIKGQLVKKWGAPKDKQWGRAELLRNGDLLVIGNLGKRPGPSGKVPRVPKYLARYDWHGRLLWQKRFMLHHDLDVDPNGTIYALGQRGRQIDESLHIADHTIVTFSANGEPQREVSLYDLLSSDPELFRLPRTTDHPHGVTKAGRIDLLHANALNLMPFPSLTKRGPLYAATNVLVTVRHQNLVAIIDLETERLLWAWGPGEVQYPHEATWLENGNILLFDNGTEQRGYSRIVEVDPTTDKVIWTYTAKKPKRFFSAGRGTVQALANGNVLVASSNQGKIFEATRKGDVVWRYFHRGEDGQLLAMRAKRYPPAMVEKLLDSSPGISTERP